ncbi:hypothetical protein LIER_20714 [Lithospermum erythrorhizon]|uniref:Uncharacterized protein n=1 Tax=Lithospermum erythrorhizon TaxID=34254 RepID=A0AAV3QQB7_LITER
MDTRSGSSSVCCIGAEQSPSEVAALRRLSETLESIFLGNLQPDFGYADAEIVDAGGTVIPVHRCILSARSPFFRSVFGCKARNVRVKLKDWMKERDVSYEALITVVRYMYSGKVRAAPEGVCVCVDEECSHLACRPVVEFMVDALYASFVFQISDLVSRFQGDLLDIVDKATTDDILMVLSVASMCSKVCKRLLKRCIEIIVQSDVDVVTLDNALPHPIVKQIIDMRMDLGSQGPERSDFPDKHVKRIHRALESDDVELVRMLLKEGHTTLDDACALHYAVAYCDPKTTAELLDLALADVNHKNSRGYTVLHIAAMRKEPKIVVSLLTKGARPSELTSDGRKALQISKRLTRAVDYQKETANGKATPNERLCIEILEQAESRDPLLGEASVSLAMAGDALRMKLLYLENRVGLAKLLFPMEAKVAMDIAQVDGTSEFPLASMKKKLADAHRKTVDLNDSPFKLKEEHLNRLRALSKTVELGKRFFPRCSEVLNKIMDADDLSEIAYMESGSPEERKLKKQRYVELQEVLSKAFTEDKEEFQRANNFSSSSSSSVGVLDSNCKAILKK